MLRECTRYNLRVALALDNAQGQVNATFSAPLLFANGDLLERVLFAHGPLRIN